MPFAARIGRSRFQNGPSKLARFPLLEGHPCWSMCARPTRALLRPRVARAQKHHVPFPPLLLIAESRRATISHSGIA